MKPTAKSEIVFTRYVLYLMHCFTFTYEINFAEKIPFYIFAFVIKGLYLHIMSIRITFFYIEPFYVIITTFTNEMVLY